MTAAIFWLALLAVAYAYVGYPLLLRLGGGRRAWSGPRGAARPRLSVIVAAYNEAGCIADKLRSTLITQRYPRDRVEAIVVSDGSTDDTDACVNAFRDGRALLVRQEPRSGKSLALNRGVAASSGDVLVFTDANALFAPDALARLAAHFDDPRVGVVSGQGLYGGRGGDARAVSGGYVRYEAFVKAGESRHGFLASADGAIYAMRRRLYRDLRADEVNDLLHPIQATLAGYESRFEAGAFTIEPPSAGGGQEFRRHARIIAQGMHLLRRWLPPLMAARRGREVWMLVSHRILRWSSAPFLLIALLANVALLDDAPLYTATLAAQLGFYALALVGWLAERAKVNVGKLAVPYFFCLVSAAGVAAFVRFLRGDAQAVWAPTSQATVEERAA